MLLQDVVAALNLYHGYCIYEYIHCARRCFKGVSMFCIYTKAIFENTISSLCDKYKYLRPKRYFFVFGLSIRLLF